MLTHLPARTWCDFCMKGKVREDGHFKRPEGVNPSEVPRVSMDYCFLGRYISNPPGEATATVAELKQAQDDEEGALPVLVITDEKSGCIFAGVVNKGVDKYAVHLVTEGLRSTGHQKMILMTDAEPSIRALAEAAGKEWGKECQIQVASRESHASNGAARKGLSLSWRGTGNPRPPSGVQTWEACLNGRQVADRLSPSQTVGPFVGPS